MALSGRSLVEHAVRRALASGAVTDVVVAAPRGHVDALAAILQKISSATGVPVTVVAGGTTRQLSVWYGLRALSASSADVVLVHDAARCLAPPNLFTRVTDAVRSGSVGVVPALPVTDTIRSVDDGIVDRSRLRAVQTPQGFRHDVLVAAHSAAAQQADDESTAATDDAGLVERLGETVALVDGDPLAFKITTALDLVLAEGVLRSGLGEAEG